MEWQELYISFVQGCRGKKCHQELMGPFQKNGPSILTIATVLLFAPSVTIFLMYLAPSFMYLSF